MVKSEENIKKAREKVRTAKEKLEEEYLNKMISSEAYREKKERFRKLELDLNDIERKFKKTVRSLKNKKKEMEKQK